MYIYIDKTNPHSTESCLTNQVNQVNRRSIIGVDFDHPFEQ